MKYTTKRSKVEEVVIDLEDGCILKLTRNNVISMGSDKIYEKHHFLGQTHGTFSHYEVNIVMTNGIDYEFKTLDEQLVEDIYSLSYT